jgi:hypothetical protein
VWRVSPGMDGPARDLVEQIAAKQQDFLKLAGG